MSPYKKAEALVSQVCLVLLYSCGVGVKSADLDYYPQGPANRSVKFDTHRTNTLDWYIFVNELPKGHPSIHTCFH